jgi:hypothetical protein
MKSLLLGSSNHLVNIVAVSKSKLTSLRIVAM